jgi:hypothetical protein
MHYKGLVGGLPQFDLYNIMRDPRDLHTPVPFGQLVQLHLEQMLQFPDRKLDPKTGKEVETQKRPTSSWEVGPDMN